MTNNKSLPVIKICDPQPVACSKCDGFYGYQYSDHMKVHYTSQHSRDGKYEGGSYTDSVNILNRGSTPYCANCGTKLRFKIIRSNNERVE